MSKVKNPHPFMTQEWYKWTHHCLEHVHDTFCKWALGRWNNFSTVLEVGCGMYGFYHRFFADKEYVGCDISPDVIACCNERHGGGNQGLGYNPKHMFTLWDFGVGGPLDNSFDLIFSHAVIDHAVDIPTFIARSIQASSRYIYIMSYRGYFADIEEHQQEKGKDGYCYNNISVPAVRRQLQACNLKSFDLISVPTHRAGAEEIQEELAIIIEK